MIRRPIALLAITTVLVAMSLARSGRADEPAAAPTATSSMEEEARARVKRGLELYDEGDYKLALIELERAYEILPSYKILYNLAQIHAQLGQYAKAHDALTRYLAEGGTEIPPERRAEVEADLASFVKRIASITIETNVAGAEIMIDDRPVGTAPLAKLHVDAGSVRVAASKPGYVTVTRVITLAGGDETSVRLDLTSAFVVAPPPAPPAADDKTSPLVVGAWIGTGVLVAGAIGTGIATIATNSHFDSMREAPIAGSAAQAKQDIERQGNLVDALALTTDVLIVTSIVAGGVSLYLTLTANSPSSKSAKTTATSWSRAGFAF